MNHKKVSSVKMRSWEHKTIETRLSRRDLFSCDRLPT